MQKEDCNTVCTRQYQKRRESDSLLREESKNPMHKISYTYTNKAKIILYLMIVALCLLRLTLLVQIKLYRLEDYEVYLLPSLLYYFIIISVFTLCFFGYKFFYTVYNDHEITYCSVLRNKKYSITLDHIGFVRFDRRGIFLCEDAAHGDRESCLLFIPFFRFGIIDALSVNSFFEFLLTQEHIQIQKTFKVLPGYGKSWMILSLLYSLISFCLLIVSMEPLYTVIVLYQTFS